MTGPYANVAVYKGGISSEREVSLRSGRAVAAGLRTAGYEVQEVDVVDREPPVPPTSEAVFIALHGVFGEDGGVQRYLEELGIPYTGSGTDASRRAFDKRLSKDLMASHGIPTAPYEILPRGAERSLGLPVVVKPIREGSSIGISRVLEEADWAPAAQKAFGYGDEILVEKFVRGRECTVGIVGREPLPIVEIIARDSDYSYEAKYSDSATRYVVPADLPEEVARDCRAAAMAFFELLQCRGFARVDMLVDAQGSPQVLELNSIPGFTESSLLPKAACAAGIEFSHLCDRIMGMAGH